MVACSALARSVLALQRLVLIALPTAGKIFIFSLVRFLLRVVVLAVVVVIIVAFVVVAVLLLDVPKILNKCPQHLLFMSGEHERHSKCH